MSGLFLWGCWRVVKESVREGGMTGSQIEETITCTRLGSSSALSFNFCCHRSRENAAFWFTCTTLPQCHKDMAHILTKGTSYTDVMAVYLLFTSLLCDTAGFLQFKLSLFAIAALQILLHGALHGAWSNHTAHILILIEERRQRLYRSNCLIAKYWSIRGIIYLNKLFHSISLYLCFD